MGGAYFLYIFSFIFCGASGNHILTLVTFPSISFISGPDNWGGVCSTGRKQSPIDIKKTETVFDKGLGAFQLTNYDRKLNKTFRGFNSGYALELAFPAGVYNVSGGGLPGVYTTVQFHFHYGPNNSVGSEHTVNGEQFAAEVSHCRRSS